MDFTSVLEPFSLETANVSVASSNLFTAPVFPKIVVVGLSGHQEDSLKQFKEILSKALDNLFVIEFSEQYIPYVPNNKAFESIRSGYRSHQVKESWMHKVRYERPAILIDFRLLADYQTLNGDDSFLCEQIIQTKNYLSNDGPVYTVWLAGSLSSNRLNTLIRTTKMDKSTMLNIELFQDFHLVTTSLKPKIQECFEHSRYYYKELSKKYKKLMTIPAQIQKFMHPWMCSVYYYFKMAVVEEFRGDFQSALKYYHSILAKFKEIIEESNVNRCSTINLLRPFSDICFLRLSFLLFRLNQGGEAEFGLYRYLAYFSSGLSKNDQFLWKYNLIRTYSKLLSTSFIWSPGSEEKLMRGPAHFLIFAISMAVKYVATSNSDDSYYLQESIMYDLGSALESALKNPKLEYFVDYLQILILEQYEQTSDQLSEAGIVYLNYLKNCPKLDGWQLKQYFLEKSISLVSQQDYKSAAIDIWTWSFYQKTFNLGYTALFEDLCLMHKQVFNESIRFNFPHFLNKFIFCSVKFTQPSCPISDECFVELYIYNAFEGYDVYPESIGIFFDDQSVEGVSFICTESDVFKAGNISKFKGAFVPKKYGNGELNISFITMQLSKPCLVLQFDDSSFLHQQSKQSIDSFDLLDFSRFSSHIQRNGLKLKIEPLKPELLIEFEILNSDKILIGLWTPILVKIANLTDHHTSVDLFNVSSLNVEVESKTMHVEVGPRECNSVNLLCKFKSQAILKLTCLKRFNLQLIDFNYSDICSFDPIKTEHKSEIINPISPFIISLVKSSCGKLKIKLVAFSQTNWLYLKSSSEDSFNDFRLETGEVKYFSINAVPSKLYGSFALDPSSEIIEYTWIIK